MRTAVVVLVDEMDQALETKTELNLPTGDKTKVDVLLAEVALWVWLAVPNWLMQSIR